MFSSIAYALLCVIVLLINAKTCSSHLSPLTMYIPDEPDYIDVLVRKQHEDLTLVCEVRDDKLPRRFIWNYIPNNSHGEMRTFIRESTVEPSTRSQLVKRDLQLNDTGHYMCSSLPYSVSKLILVQPLQASPPSCARGAFRCANRCVLGAYVCDGHSDCPNGEDEAPGMCTERPCAGADKLNCSSGRCISQGACCRGAGPLCRAHACCHEHAMYQDQGYLEIEYPPVHEDRHAPDEYGFIQSTIYTVTACALIFMIAVVLLVSAICKMHMKRAALRSYTHATRRHYTVQYAQNQRFPPCYEASRLLEQDGRLPSPALSPHTSPVRHALQCNSECGDGAAVEEPAAECEGSGFGLARLSTIFTSRYRQVPTQCLEVEMRDIRPLSSPVECGPAPSPPDTRPPRPLTLHLGRFQLSIPRFGRRLSEPRPDTPNVAELNINDIDFVRLNSNDTYTLNGRTIRLLGGNFENYPVLTESNRPPPYTDAMRYKLYGPPPEYLSRDGLNLNANVVDANSAVVNANSDCNIDEEAASNVEMPPCYDELASGVDSNANCDTGGGDTGRVDNGNPVRNDTGYDTVVDNLPAIDCDVNANDSVAVGH